MTVAAAPRIRDATQEDLQAVAEIYAHHVLHGLATFEEVPPEVAEIARRCRAIQAAGRPYLVALGEGGEVLGFAYAGDYRPRPAYRFTLEDSVYVAPDQARRGVGSALLAELIARATAAGYRQMVAVIGDSGNQGSIRLHERHGFTRAALLRAVGFKLGRWVDVVIMQRALGDGDRTPPVA